MSSWSQKVSLAHGQPGEQVEGQSIGNNPFPLRKSPSGLPRDLPENVGSSHDLDILLPNLKRWPFLFPLPRMLLTQHSGSRGSTIGTKDKEKPCLERKKGMKEERKEREGEGHFLT